MLRTILMLVYILSWMHCSVANIVATVQGKIRGGEHDGFLSYIGIPYASVNKNGGRFKKGGLAPTWVGIRDSWDSYCTSRSEVQDCLELDVFTPRVGSSWPVMVWVKGSSGDYWPEKLVKQGIVVVVVRHRLGPVGFMCSRDENIPGNAGVKDIVLALRWVRDNIVAFKGNPHRVVVAGQGLGAAMVEALTLSPMSQGLFHGAIMQSGSILAPWAFNYDANDRTRYLRMMINETDISRSSINNLVTSAEELDLPYFPFGICAEKEIKNEESLLTEAPFNILMKGNMSVVPKVIGYNSNEAYVFVSMLQDVKVVRKMSRDAAFLLPTEFESLSDREMTPIIKQIKDIYFRDGTALSSALDYHRDAYFLSHIHRSAKLHAAQGPVYYYQFSHSGSVGVEPETEAQKSGAAHSDELAYLFPTKDLDFEGDDITVHMHLVHLWSSFVKNLKPETPGLEWITLDPYHPRVLDIKSGLEMVEFPHRRTMNFWEDVYEKYYYRRH